MVERFNVSLKVNNTKTEEVEFTFLEQLIIGGETRFDSVDEFIEQYFYSEAQAVVDAFKNYNYEIQSYLVHFDTETPVNVSVSVYHEYETILSEDEILIEAIGYLEDIGISFEKSDATTIEVSQLIL